MIVVVVFIVELIINFDSGNKSIIKIMKGKDFKVFIMIFKMVLNFFILYMLFFFVIISSIFIGNLSNNENIVERNIIYIVLIVEIVSIFIIGFLKFLNRGLIKELIFIIYYFYYNIYSLYKFYCFCLCS